MTSVNFLEGIVSAKRRELCLKKEKLPFERMKKALNPSEKDFRAAIEGKQKISLVAEIKVASPLAGTLLQGISPVEIAALYAKYADAVSFVSDKSYFKGNIADLPKVSSVSGLPVLMKDFIIDEYQILEARFFEADAVLLIASLLKTETLRDFISTAERLSMHCVVEVHSRPELDKALEAGAGIIGINNRNLSDFSVDMNTTKNLAPFVPKKKVVISESGFSSRHDVEKFRGDIDAILVGTAILKAQDREAMLKELSGRQ